MNSGIIIGELKSILEPRYVGTGSQPIVGFIIAPAGGDKDVYLEVKFGMANRIYDFDLRDYLKIEYFLSSRYWKPTDKWFTDFNVLKIESVNKNDY